MACIQEQKQAHPARPGWMVVATLLALLTGSASAAQLVVQGPSGSNSFGRVTTLPNGNIVVIDDEFDAPGPIPAVGAVHLYRPDGTLISTLTGSNAGDQVGLLGVTVLTTGDFVVNSFRWRNGAAAQAGAVTWISASTGLNGVVSPSNSLVGSRTGDQIGYNRVTALPNGAYLVRSATWDNGTNVDAGAATLSTAVDGIRGVVSEVNSLVGTSALDRVGEEDPVVLANGNLVLRTPRWDNGALADAGAVTFVSTVDGVNGAVSPANSLVGSSAGDRVGNGGVTPLNNGSYVVVSPDWRNGDAAEAGAATFGSRDRGISGPISPLNSLVGTSAGDRVGDGGATALINGNYVVASALWRNGSLPFAGAVTFALGTEGITGPVSIGNSLVGDRANAFVGVSVVALANGNYVVSSPFWDADTVEDVGAVTFGSGSTGLVGEVSTANSLVGAAAGDLLGFPGVTPLTNGNFVVRSSRWDNGEVANAGAATFGSGTAGLTGSVSPSNSLVGSSVDDRISAEGVVALTNGNYVVRSTHWDNGATIDAGAATFGSGVEGISGVVSPANSLVGSSRFDRVGGYGVVALPNGNYVVRSPEWDSVPGLSVGAATFGSGNEGVRGEISSMNSLVGSSSGDAISEGGVTVLANGNYVVRSASWSDGDIANVGAVTLGSGRGGISGFVSSSNSHVGSTRDDQVGIQGVTAFSGGNYVIDSPAWSSGSQLGAGAITLGLADGSLTGELSELNSVLGADLGGGYLLSFDYDPERNQLAVGDQNRNRLVLLRMGIETATRIVSGPPSPAPLEEPVTFIATVSASSAPPIDGQVTFSASTGERCSDAVPILVAQSSAQFSCTIEFAQGGARTVVAEYTGSVIYAYSRSSPRALNLIDRLFGAGFEPKAVVVAGEFD